MADKGKLKPIAIALSTVFVTSLTGAGIANAAENPFSMTELSSGYMVAGMEGKCGEGKCGGMKTDKEGNCGGAMCDKMKGRHMQMMDSDGDGKVSKEEFLGGHAAMFDKMDTNGDRMLDESESMGMKRGMEGKCGEGKCGGMNKGMEGASDGMKKGMEGKCGEGKCGGKK